MGTPPTRLSELWLIAVVCAAHALSMAGFATYPALLPDLRSLWGLSNTGAGWISSSFFAAYTVAVPVLVSLTDRVDPRRIYLVSALVSAAGLVGFAVLADGLAGALLCQGLLGLGIAGTYMPGLKALTDHVGGRLRSRAVAFYTAHFSIGASLSFLLTGEVSAWFGWRWAFAVAGLGPLLAFVLVLGLLPRWSPPRTATRRALLDFRPVLRNRAALAYILGYAAHCWELFALRSWLVAFLVFAQSQQAPDALGAGWSATAIAAVISLVGVPASVLGNEAAERFQRRRVVVLIMGASALGAMALGFLASLPFPVVVLACLAYAALIQGDSATLTAGAVESAAPGERGATMAVHSTLGFAASALGPLAVGLTLDLVGGDDRVAAWGLGFATSAVVLAGGMAAVWGLGREPGRGIG